MAYPHTPNLDFPLEDYCVNSYGFKQDCTYNDMHWGIHLGEDVNCPFGTGVKSIGRGKVVYSALHAGSEKRSNWGNIIIVVHKHPKTKKLFFSLYAHLQDRFVSVGDRVELGQLIGKIGKSNSPVNGWWEDEHLHFSIYVGPWRGRVLPGYWKKDSTLTELKYWKDPSVFVREYNV